MGDLFWTGLKWLLMVLVWGTLTYGIVGEDRRLRHLKEPNLRDLPALLQMLHMRNIQVWVLITLLLLITATHDIRYDLSLAPTHIAVTPAPEQLPAPEAASPAPVNDKAFATPKANSLPFSDITEFNEKDSKQQAYLDWLKQRFEAWLVTYYYLQKCGKTGADDLTLIDNALQKELASAHADNTVRNNILLAATGSYNEMYRDIPCDNEHLTATKSTYDANMQQLKRAPATGGEPAAR